MRHRQLRDGSWEDVGLDPAWKSKTPTPKGKPKEAIRKAVEVFQKKNKGNSK